MFLFLELDKVVFFLQHFFNIFLDIVMAGFKVNSNQLSVDGKPIM